MKRSEKLLVSTWVSYIIDLGLPFVLLERIGGTSMDDPIFVDGLGIVFNESAVGRISVLNRRVGTQDHINPKADHPFPAVRPWHTYHSRKRYFNNSMEFTRAGTSPQELTRNPSSAYRVRTVRRSSNLHHDISLGPQR